MNHYTTQREHMFVLIEAYRVLWEIE